MTSTDDPDRDRKPSSPNSTKQQAGPIRVRSTVSWSTAARREYSSADTAPRVEIGKVARGAVKSTLRHLSAHSASLDRFGLARSFAVEISLISDGEMQELNSTYRGKNKPTDVLSFAQHEGEAFPIAHEKVLFGDLVIAIGTAQRQAQELNHSLQHEIAFLAVHGVLHLCGFDHDTAARRRAMWKLQDAIFAEIFPNA